MQSKIRTLVIDDEYLAREKIISLLNTRSDIEVCGECANGIEAIEMIEQEAPDLVFLDIQMPEMNGFELIESVGIESMPAVIFVTAFEQYAVKAFEVHAQDYLLKPFNSRQLFASIDHAITTIHNQQPDQGYDQLLRLLKGNASSKAYSTKILIRETDCVFFKNVNEIYWIESEGNYVKIHFNEKHFLLRETMKKMETKLDPTLFLRIHRSYIVNINQIKKVKDFVGPHTTVVLNDGTELFMSQRYRGALNKVIGDFL